MPPQRTYKKNRKMKKPIATNKVDQVQDKQLVNLQKEVMKLKKQPELKYCDEYDLLPASIPPSGRLSVPLSPFLLRGTSPTQRIGDQIMLKRWKIQVKCLANGLNLQATYMRFIVFIDKAYNGSSPSLALRTPANNFTLLDDTVIADTIMSPYNLDTLDSRFKILDDTTVRLLPQTVSQTTQVGLVYNATAYTPQHYIYKRSFTLNRIAKFVANVGNNTDLAGAQPLLAIFSDQPLNQPLVVFSGRMTFTDE